MVMAKPKWANNGKGGSGDGPGRARRESRSMLILDVLILDFGVETQTTNTLLYDGDMQMPDASLSTFDIDMARGRNL